MKEEELNEKLSEQDKIKERVRFNIEKFRLSVICVLTIGGGTISLIMSYPFGGARNIFIAFGFVVAVGALVYSYKVYVRTVKLLKE